ncbi:MAG: ABC transporter permease [Caldisphaeraceae archaeon]|nr:ABC transporter permease [Caldisphaeraceae archaeon]
MKMIPIKKTIFRNRLITVGVIIIIIDFVLGVVGQFWQPYSPAQIFVSGLPPSTSHLLGTDNYGHDVFSVMLISTLPTLLVGIGVGILTTLISSIIALLSGYYGYGRKGILIDMATILALAIPGIILLIIIGAYFASASKAFGYFGIVLTLSVTGWAWGAKTMRSQVLSLSNREYILASKLIGEKPWKIMLDQLLPPIFPLVIGQFLFGTLYGILSLATAEFFGAIPVTTQNLGTMMSLISSSSAYLIGYWWWILGAILPIIIVAIGIGMLMIGLDEITDPRLKKIRVRFREPQISIPTDEKIILLNLPKEVEI